MKKSAEFVHKLTNILVKNKVIAQQEAKNLQQSFENKITAGGFDYFLLDQGLVSVKNLLEALSEYYQVPYTDVTGLFFERDMLHKFPKDFLLTHYIVPLELDDNNLMIMVAGQPDAPGLLQAIGTIVPYDIQFTVGLHWDITDAVKEYYDKSVTQEDPDDQDQDYFFDVVDEDEI